MVDLSAGLEKLPPAERLRRLRAIEAQKRRELEEDLQKQKKGVEEELARKKKELEELERRTKQEIERAEELQDETIEELTREQGREQAEELEDRVKRFREGNEFVPENLEEQLAARGRPIGRAAPGFGQTGGYQAPQFDRAEQNIAYLMNSANPMSDEARHKTESELYRNVRELAGRNPELLEDYQFERLQHALHELQTTRRDDGYVNHIASFLNSIVDYRQDDERRRRSR